MDPNIEKLVAELEKSLAEDSFVKLVLSNYKGSDRALQKISVRIIETKKGRQLMCQSRFDTRDIIKNIPVGEAAAEFRRHLASGFRNAHLFTTLGDLQLVIGKRNSRLAFGKAVLTERPSLAHDRTKNTLINRNAFYLKALGIADDNGRIKPSQQDKWRQISKFVEVLANLIEHSDLKGKPDLKVADMGSGKGYLTFAAYDFLTSGTATVTERASSPSDEARLVRNLVSARNVQMIGVEQRPELVALCNDIAKAGNLDGLKFVHGPISDFDLAKVDIVIALHACDTATDDAIYKGMVAEASIIVAAPCCHKEIRTQMKLPKMLAGLLKHGVLLERTAESITDGLRALLLESKGYGVKMIEFVPTEHTPKNNLLAAVRRKDHARNANAKIEASGVMDTFGIRDQRLYRLLEKDSPTETEKISAALS